jgi:hypothetical protein
MDTSGLISIYLTAELVEKLQRWATLSGCTWQCLASDVLDKCSNAALGESCSDYSAQPDGDD